MKPGDELYVPSSYYSDHGQDDICGGIATIESCKPYPVDNGPEVEWTVVFSELPGRSYFLTYLLSKQEGLREAYGDRMAHRCPDVPGAPPCPNLGGQRWPLRMTEESILTAAAKEVDYAE